MRTTRDKQIRYGIPSGVLAFIAGWAIVAYLTPQDLFSGNPRWQTTLWVYLGAHLIELSNVYQGGLGFGSAQIIESITVPSEIYLIPIGAVAISAFYTAFNMRSPRLKHNVSNALAGGTGYFLSALAAMVISDVQPSMTMILVLALIVGAGLWLGSSFLGFFTRGIPIIGVASLGSIAALGILLFMGGITLLSSIWGLVAISFGVSAVVGTGLGVSRKLERRGRHHNTNFSRLYGLRLYLEDNWLVISVSVIVLVGLFIGLKGGI